MITFNGVEPPEYPNDVNENPTQAKTDSYAIDNTKSRTQYPSKKRSVCKYEMASPTTYQFFRALYDAATSVVYINTDSNVSGGTLQFSGIIDVDEDDYIRGGSLSAPLTVVIEEGQVIGA